MGRLFHDLREELYVISVNNSLTHRMMRWSLWWQRDNGVNTGAGLIVMGTSGYPDSDLYMIQCTNKVWLPWLTRYIMLYTQLYEGSLFTILKAVHMISMVSKELRDKPFNLCVGMVVLWRRNVFTCIWIIRLFTKTSILKVIKHDFSGCLLISSFLQCKN